MPSQNHSSAQSRTYLVLRQLFTQLLPADIQAAPRAPSQKLQPSDRRKMFMVMRLDLQRGNLGRVVWAITLQHMLQGVLRSIS
jgi:hypothetical protein